MQVIYALLCVVGFALPLSQFAPWVASHGLNISLLVEEAVAGPISAFAWADVLVSGIAVAVFIVAEGRRCSVERLWLPLSCLAVGPSLALPVFLLLRERQDR